MSQNKSVKATRLVARSDRSGQLIATVEKAKGDDWTMTLSSRDGRVVALASGKPGFVMEVQAAALKGGIRGVRRAFAEIGRHHA